MAEVIKMLKHRNQIYLATAVSFVVWQAAALVGGLFAHNASLVSMTQILSYIGIGAWVICTILLMRHHARVKSARMTMVLNDEVAQANFKKAIQVGFLTTITAVCIALAFADQLAIGVSALARGLLIIAVFTTLVAYVWFERSDESVD